MITTAEKHQTNIKKIKPNEHHPAGAHTITCTCGHQQTEPGPRENALTAAWDHEDYWTRQAHAKARRNRQCRARRRRAI